MKIQFLKTKKNFKKKNLRRDLYWKLLISVACILSILFASFGYYLFHRIKTEPVPPAETAAGSRIVKKDRLEKALDYFNEREKKSATILNSRPNVVDPSL